jgi:capsular polysaccharide biosynthesis protein
VNATELREAAKRILWHWKLLALFAVLGIVLPLVLLRGEDPTYVASTRFLVTTATEAPGSIADTAEAIATSPSQLAWALRRAGIEANPEALADAVSVHTVGDSGVIQLSVHSEDPVLAAAVANAIRDQVVVVMRDPEQQVADPARLLDRATAAAARKVPPLRSQDLVLGAVLGLILGIAAACLIEALHPTLVGSEAIAGQLGAPVLGVVALKPDGADEDPNDLRWLRWRLGAQAARAGVATVELAAVDPSVDLAPISAALVTNGSTPPPRQSSATAGQPAARLKVGVLDTTSIFPRGSAGLVVVTPKTVKKSAFESAQELLRITGWPAVGAIVYGRDPLFPSSGTFGRGGEPAGRRLLSSVKQVVAAAYRANAARPDPASPAGAAAREGGPGSTP